MNYLRMELKVCEGCGALWLRMETAGSVYCRGCASRLAAFPAPRKRHAGGRPRRSVRSTGCTSAAAVGGAR